MNKARDFLEEHLRTILIALIAVIVIVLAAVVFSVAVEETGARTLYISEVAGGASIIKGDGQIAASRNMAVNSGDVIVTDSEGIVKLKTDNGKYIYVEPMSTVYVDYTEKKEKGSVIVNISDGSVLCRLDGKLKKDSSFEVRTPNAIISVKGTVFHVNFKYYNNYNSYSGVMLTRVNAIENNLKLQLYNINGEKSGDPQLLGEGLCAELMSCAGFNGYNYLNEETNLTELTATTLRTLIRISGERTLPLELTELNDAFNAVYGRPETQTEEPITVPTTTASTISDFTAAPFGALPENTDRSVVTVAPVPETIYTETRTEQMTEIFTAEISTITSPTETETETETSSSEQTTVSVTTTVPQTTVPKITTTAPKVTTTAPTVTTAPRITTKAPVTTTTAAPITTTETSPQTVYVPPETTLPEPVVTTAPETVTSAEKTTTVTENTTAETTTETTTASLNWWEIINSNNTASAED